MRRLVASAVLACALPTVTAAALVRSASATSSAAAYSSFGVTALAGGIRTLGDVGASGGLVTLDSGSAYVRARLDAAPSADVLAAAVEPGTLVRTVVGQVNTTAGMSVLSVPDAEAAYPGIGKASTDAAGPQTVGPLALRGGSASASAGPHSGQALAIGAAIAAPGLLESTGSFSNVVMTGDASKATYATNATSGVNDLVVAGVLSMHGVSATARVAGLGLKTMSEASLAVSSASVAGIAVTIDAEGAHALGQNVSAGTLRALQSQVNAVLKAAHVEVHAFDVIHSVSGREALADSGGIAVSVLTPDLPGGVTSNHLSIVLGKVTLTGISSLAVPVPTVVGLPPSVPISDVPSAPAVAPGVLSPSVPPLGGQLPSVSRGGRQVRVAGYRMSAATALGAFGCWQLLSLSSATLYAIVDRRRRLRLAEAAL